MSHPLAQGRLLVALDLPTARSAEQVVKQFSGQVGGFKVGAELFMAEGPAISDLILGMGASLFLDLKLHDIPRTVEAGARALAKQGARWLTVHASGGSDMLAAAVQGASVNKNTTVLAVTVLTSHSDASLRELGVASPLAAQVSLLATLAKNAGVPGLVCSAHEAASLRALVGPDMILVCPGIRPAGGQSHDQKRVATPSEAIRAGANYLVVGRPILEAPDLCGALSAVIEEIATALT